MMNELTSENVEHGRSCKSSGRNGEEKREQVH